MCLQDTSDDRTPPRITPFGADFASFFDEFQAIPPYVEAPEPQQVSQNAPAARSPRRIGFRWVRGRFTLRAESQLPRREMSELVGIVTCRGENKSRPPRNP